VLTGEVTVFTGKTPFSWWGSWPMILICLLLLFIPGRYRRTAEKLLARLLNWRSPE